MSPKTLRFTALLLLVLVGIAAYRVFFTQTTSSSPVLPQKANLTGEMAKLDLYETPEVLPDYPIQLFDGSPASLTDLKGKVMLINLWASWCAPCRAEMKELAALNDHLGGDDFEVVALNVDRGGIKKAKITLEEWGIEGLEYYADKTQNISFKWAEGKLPTSFIVSKDGLVIGEYIGPLKWDAPESIAFFKQLIAS